MVGEWWSCFARLPAGIADQSVTLTLNWLRPKPTRDEFELLADEVEGAARRRVNRLRGFSAVALVLMIGGAIASWATGTEQALALLGQPGTGKTMSWLGLGIGAIAFAFLAQASVAEARYRRAAPRRIAYEEAVRRFSSVAAWRETRAETAFWSSKLDETGFEREAAELLAGHFKTGRVMLTRAENDYGVDVLICTGKEKIVAQCKQWRGRQISAQDVRALAGAKAYFGADLALLITLSGPTQEQEQCADIAQTQNLELWDAAKIVAVARDLSA